MNPAISPVAGVDRAFIYIIGFSAVLLVGITATMIAFVVRYRRSRNPVSTDIRGHAGLEIAWMIIPTAIALSMFYIGWDSYLGLRNVPPDALQINVTAESFAWNFAYPGGKESVNELVVPLGQPVKLNITSKDVIHSLFIPAYRIKMDAVKGLTSYTWFMADRPGTYTIMCAEFCGLGHAEMNADLKIVPPADYESWLARREAEPAPDTNAVSPEVLRLFDVQQFHKLEDKMTFWWRVDGPLLHVKLRAPGAGWLAIGFNPKRGMLGANFIIGYVKNGRLLMADEFGTGPVRHEADERLGGQRDIRNAFGSEQDGATEIAFSIPLASGDSADGVIDPDGETTVLLAYSSGLDDLRSKHNYRGAFRVKLAAGTYTHAGRER